MNIEEFRELVKAVQDKSASVRSATQHERERELCGLQGWIMKLREAKWPARLSQADREKALRVLNGANELIAEVMA